MRHKSKAGANFFAPNGNGDHHPSSFPSLSLSWWVSIIASTFVIAFCLLFAPCHAVSTRTKTEKLKRGGNEMKRISGDSLALFFFRAGLVLALIPVHCHTPHWIDHWRWWRRSRRRRGRSVVTWSRTGSTQWPPYIIAFQTFFFREGKLVGKTMQGCFWAPECPNLHRSVLGKVYFISLCLLQLSQHWHDMPLIHMLMIRLGQDSAMLGARDTDDGERQPAMFAWLQLSPQVRNAEFTSSSFKLLGIV